MKNHSPKCAGFTLIEMALVVMILGLAAATFAPIYKLYLFEKAQRQTNINVKAIADAIGSYRTINGRYPCPASPSLKRGDTLYGREDCTQITAPLGTPGPNGIIREQSISTRKFSYLNPFTNIMLPNTSRPISVVGFVPFRQLNLDESQAYDAYGHRIMYIVTEHLAHDTSFTPDTGGIDIVNDAGTSIVNPAASAHFLVLSYGANGLGAYSANGTRSGCPLVGTFIEQDNCNFSTGTASYRAAQINTSGGNKNFDDVMSYFTLNDMPIWQKISDTAALKDSITDKPSGDIGIAYQDNTVTLGHRADLNGDVRAQDDPVTPAVDGGKIMARTVCNDDGTTCLNTAKIGGDIANGGGMQCPGDDHTSNAADKGPFMVGIRNGEPICRKDVVARCKDASSVVIGINSDGGLICNDPPPKDCDFAQFAFCGALTEVPAGPNGSTQTVTGGDNATHTFTCDNGTWVGEDSGGACECAPLTGSFTSSCDDGFTGTVTNNCVVSCPTGAISCTNNAATACTCAGKTETDVEHCDTGYTGTLTSTRVFTCTDPHNGTWSNWTTTGHCTCTPQTITQEVDCGGGLTGTKKQQATISCPSGHWSAWVDTDTSGCHCTPESHTETEDCPSSQIGAITNQVTTTCPSGSITSVQVGTTCTDPGPLSCSWKSTGTVLEANAASPRGKRINSAGCTCQDVTSTCYSGGSNGSYTIYGPCQCN